VRHDKLPTVSIQVLLIEPRFELPERSYGVRAIMGLKDLCGENVRFLTPGAHKPLKFGRTQVFDAMLEGVMYLQTLGH